MHHVQVQDAILHNKRIFEQRMMQQDRTLLRKVLGGWRAVRYGSVAKQALLRRAAARIARGALARAFFAWKDELHLVDRNLAMKRKVRIRCCSWRFTSAAFICSPQQPRSSRW
jgi:hypothetical protein